MKDMTKVEAPVKSRSTHRTIRNDAIAVRQHILSDLSFYKGSEQFLTTPLDAIVIESLGVVPLH